MLGQHNYYKIRNKKTGLFREGGMFAKWTKHGKEWTCIGHLKNHLSLFPANKIDWDNWEVVEYSYAPTETGSFPLGDLL